MIFISIQHAQLLPDGRCGEAKNIAPTVKPRVCRDTGALKALFSAMQDSYHA